ncbi:hypothetical protein R1sor_025987 [Riccia sorocarpa]|uniref:HTH CENPB-type domain-containing protein n=1 Tax=Riccia sorocarpa TaxID=122646 RepID=A0ABD3GFT5_9MARC
MPRVELTLKERVEIYRHHAVSSRITNKALSVWATEEMKRPISEVTISRILKRKSELLASQGSTHMKRYRKPECPDLERILFVWFLTMQEGNVTMSDEMLIEKARMLHNTVLHETEKEILFSNGWFQDFKRRNGISAYVRHGESASAEVTADVLDQVEGLKALISGYEPEDIFNMDETRLFFQLEPNRTLATRSIAGTKKPKARLSIALTANMTGTWKLPPFIVYKYLKPHAFTRRGIRRPENLGILWSANAKPWMTIKLFERFLLDFEKRLKKAGRRKVLLLVDNFSGDKMVSIREQIHIIRVEFLPPNVTAIYQPMDAGIIRAFKTHYRKRLIHFKLDCLQADQSFDIDVYTALLMIEKAWRIDVSSKTVRKCWVHSKLVSTEGILPDFNTLEAGADLRAGMHSDGTREIREALRQLEEMTLDSGIVPNMAFSEYIDFENVQEAFDPIAVEELAELQGMPEVDIAEEAHDHENLEVDPIISMQEWKAVTEIMRKFLEQSDRDLSKQVRTLGLIHNRSL